MTSLFLLLLGLFGMLPFIVSLSVGRRPDRARLRRSLVDAGIGGVAAMFLVAFMIGRVGEVSDRFATFLAKQGLPKSVFTWSLFYLISGAVFAGMAAGFGIGWWLRREKRPDK